MGTNGIGTALTTRRLACIHGRAHFTDPLGELSCAGAPIHDPFSGQLLGVVDLTCKERDADPVMSQLVGEAAREIERRLLDQVNGRERALINAFLQSRNLAETAPFSYAASAGLGQVDRLALEEKAAELILAGSSSTSPRLRRASATDEGGRGLFLIAQVAGRWGTRYTRNGKIIWTEQCLTPDRRLF